MRLDELSRSFKDIEEILKNIMITQEKIDRIYQLAHKKKNEGLTEEEKQEQQLLYREYIDAFRENLKFQLDMIEVVEEGKQPPAAEKEKSFEKN